VEFREADRPRWIPRGGRIPRSHSTELAEVLLHGASNIDIVVIWFYTVSVLLTGWKQ
jgi:hypothetical protein